MSNISRRISALETKAPQVAITHEERLARLRSRGQWRLPRSAPALSAKDCERLIAKVEALRGRMPIV